MRYAGNEIHSDLRFIELSKIANFGLATNSKRRECIIFGRQIVRGANVTDVMMPHGERKMIRMP